MLETSNSAGTVVAAVLETVGYATQAEILASFDAFWRSGGMLIWVIACVGAVLSLAIYGSSRMATYLLVGPILFYFLIYDRSTAAPVVYQLGGGPPKSVEEKFQGPLEDSKPPASMEVSTFFALYTKVINRFTKDIVDFILTEEKKEDIYFVTRAQVLDRVLNAVPERTKTIQIFENILGGSCLPYMDTMIALSDEQFSEEHRNRLTALASGGDKNAAAALQQINKRRAALSESISGTTTADGKKSLGIKDLRMNPNEALRTFMRDQIAAGKGDYNSMLADGAKAYGGDVKKYSEAGLPGITLTCGDAWKVIGDAAMAEGRWFLEKIYGETLRGKEDIATKRKELCNTIAAKLHTKTYVEGSSCDLTQTAALFLLRNAIRSSSASDVANRVTSRMHLIKGMKGTVCAQKVGGARNDMWMSHDETTAPAMRVSEYDVMGQKRKALERFDTKTGEWCRQIDVDAPGMFDTAFVLQQMYQSAGFKQKIYTYALNLPYWQGVILYYLAVIYPFMAILVLVPTKARTFLDMPLYWLWVKSWDVGFAMVMVLDKLLWNLLPSSELPYNGIEFKQGLELNEALPKLVGAALSVDPTFSIHLHYNFVAISLFAIPAITGAAILKARQNVLPRFTQEAEQAANDAEGLAEGQLGMRRMQGLEYQFQDFTGKGLLALGGFGQGVAATGNAGKVAQIAGAGGAITSMARIVGGAGGAGGYLQALTSGASAGVRGAQSLLTAEAKAKAAEFQAFDPTFGYAGDVARRFQSAMASMDGGGGFELHNIQQSGNNVWEKELGVLTAQLNFGMDVGGTVADAAARRASGFLGPKAGAAGGIMLKGMSIGSSWAMYRAQLGGANADEIARILAEGGIPPPDNRIELTGEELNRPGTGPRPFVPDTSKVDLRPTASAERGAKATKQVEEGLEYIGNEAYKLYEKGLKMLPKELQPKAADAVGDALEFLGGTLAEDDEE